jgi:hypothetical protein
MGYIVSLSFSGLVNLRSGFPLKFHIARQRILQNLHRKIASPAAAFPYCGDGAIRSRASRKFSGQNNR